MKRTIFWLSVMLVTFAFGVVTAFVWLYCRNLTNTKSETVVATAKDESRFDEMPILAYCELANNSEKYDGKIVRVNGTLIRGQHGTQFISPNCYSQEKKAGVVLGDQGWETLQEAKPDSFSSYEDKPVPFRRFEVIAVGKFSRTIPFPGAGPVLENSSLRFEIMRIEKASKQ